MQRQPDENPPAKQIGNVEELTAFYQSAELKAVSFTAARKAGLGKGVAEELVQETARIMLEKLTAGGCIPNAFPFAVRTVQNLVYQLRRPHRRHVALPDEVQAFSRGPHERCAADEECLSPLLAVSCLRPEERTVLFHKHYGLPLRTLADRLGFSMTGVHRRREALKEKFSSLAKELGQLPMRALASQSPNATEDSLTAFLESRGVGRFPTYFIKDAHPVPLDGSRCLIRVLLYYRDQYPDNPWVYKARSRWLTASCRLRPFFSMDSECSWALSFARPSEVLSDEEHALFESFTWFVANRLVGHFPVPRRGTRGRPDLEFWEPFRRIASEPGYRWTELPADPWVRARLAKLLRFESTERFEEAVAPLTSSLRVV